MNKFELYRKIAKTEYFEKLQKGLEPEEVVSLSKKIGIDADEAFKWLEKKEGKYFIPKDWEELKIEGIEKIEGIPIPPLVTLKSKRPFFTIIDDTFKEDYYHYTPQKEVWIATFGDGLSPVYIVTNPSFALSKKIPLMPLTSKEIGDLLESEEFLLRLYKVLKKNPVFKDFLFSLSGRMKKENPNVTKKEILERAIEEWISTFPRPLFFKVASIPDNVIPDLTQERIEKLIDQMFLGINPLLKEVALGFYFFHSDRVAQNYNPHTILLDETDIGKTYVGNLIGYVYERTTAKSLIGYATSGGQVFRGTIDRKETPIIIDEIEIYNPEVETLFTYLLEIMKTGEAEISVGGVEFSVSFFNSFIFLGNIRKEEDAMKVFARTLRAIHPNFEALGSRFGLIWYGVLGEKGRVDRIKIAKNVETAYKIKLILDEVARKLGKKRSELLGKQKIKEFLNKDISPLMLKLREGLVGGKGVERFLDIYVSYPARINFLGLSRAMWDYAEKFVKGEEVSIEELIKKAKEWRDFFIHSVVAPSLFKIKEDLVEFKPAFLRAVYDSLTDELKSFVRDIVNYATEHEVDRLFYEDLGKTLRKSRVKERILSWPKNYRKFMDLGIHIVEYEDTFLIEIKNPFELKRVIENEQED